MQEFVGYKKAGKLLELPKINMFEVSTDKTKFAIAKERRGY